MKNSFKTAGQGFCMGLTDVVPGVSGSTIALLFGIYERFIRALKSLDLRWVKPLGRVFTSKFEKKYRTEFVEQLKSMDLPWLCRLLAGLVLALIFGSFVIPMAMERFPEVTWAFFFGLVLASTSVPLRLIGKPSWSSALLCLFMALATFFLLNTRLECPANLQTFTVTQQGQTLQEITSLAPSSLSPLEVLQMKENTELREAFSHNYDINDTNAASLSNNFQPPIGIQLTLPVPYKSFMLVAGFVAISAMVLPGISGSFILLVLGSYYFVLNTLKTWLKTLFAGEFLVNHFIYCVLFGIGVLSGIVLFSRFLSWLLAKYPKMALSAILGILLGCLRGIWPFHERMPDGTLVNSLPEFTDVVFWFALCAAVLGAVLVVVINVSSRKKTLLSSVQKPKERNMGLDRG